MKIIMCGGGTAGHVSPAIAIADAIKEKYTDAEIYFIGRRGGDENRAIKKRGYTLFEISVSGLERRLTFSAIKKLFMAFSALREAKRIEREIEPDLVIGTGGYVCWPVMRAAQKMRIPSFIHESNAIPGLTVKLLSKGCDKVFLNVESAGGELKRRDNISIVGNPVTGDFVNSGKWQARRRLGIKAGEILVVSFGGSGGAEVMNRAIAELMLKREKDIGYRHVHACGRKHYEEIKKKYPSLIGEGRLSIVPYIDNMADLLCAADIAVTRSGAMTISELAASKSTAILIPSPNVADDHQTKNADVLKDGGAAIVIAERDLNSETLNEKIDYLIKNPNVRRSMVARIKKFHVPDSAKRIVSEIFELIKSGSAAD